MKHLRILLFLFVLVLFGLERPSPAQTTVDVSFNWHSARVNHGAKLLMPPLLPGDTIMIKGYIYPGGTLAPCAHLGCGALANGDPEFTPIGEIVCTGVFLDDPFVFFQKLIGGDNSVLGSEVGIFFLNMRFGEDTNNVLESRGRTLFGAGGSNPAPFAALGGTGVFSKVRAELLEIMLGPNNSGAFNFTMDLSGLRNVSTSELEALIN